MHTWAAGSLMSVLLKQLFLTLVVYIKSVDLHLCHNVSLMPEKRQKAAQFRMYI